MWVPLIENNDFDNAGADYFIRKHIDHLLASDPHIDTIVLGCTHYPLIQTKIRNYVSEDIRIVAQGEVVAQSLVDYLNRHPEISGRCSAQGLRDFYTSETPEIFNRSATLFYGKQIRCLHRVV
jgi:glutamate racemase